MDHSEGSSSVMADKLWRVTVSSLFPNDERVESIYEGHHADEALACQAALRKESTDNGGSTIAHVIRAERARSALSPSVEAWSNAALKAGNRADKDSDFAREVGKRLF